MSSRSSVLILTILAVPLGGVPGMGTQQNAYGQIRALLPPGATAEQRVNQSRVHDPIVRAAEAAMDPNGFDELVDVLAEADQDRFRYYSDRDLFVLEDRVRRLQDLWNRKYGRRFSISARGAFGDSLPALGIVAGEVDEPRLLAAHWPVAPVSRPGGWVGRDRTLRTHFNGYFIEDDDLGNDGVYDYDYQTDDEADGYFDFGYDYDADDVTYEDFTGEGDVGFEDDDFGLDEEPLDNEGAFGIGLGSGIDLSEAGAPIPEDGRDIAVVRFPAWAYLPAVNVSMIDGPRGWQIDVPRIVSPPRLHAMLLNHLNYLGAHHELWPEDPDEASRLFAHHVMMALYGLEAPLSEWSFE